MTLSKEKISHFKHLLEEMRAQIMGVDRKLSKELQSGNDSVLSQHHSEGGLEESNVETSIAIKEQNRDLLLQIDHALDRIKEGVYGVCEITGNPIPLKRLDAIPYATTTVEGQEVLEKGL